ncbi:alpha/beta hydrolase [Nonomuraea sp. NBC_01738]|uniref:alpha/beta hydrolase family protein n=1 Tax=Nonomuraea sp. NBC_01738 TaxID=2976003 RepID=UPI002E10714A|nr:alpha/beta hydrolase [Nonomuraea sp. NBC_01738]
MRHMIIAGLVALALCAGISVSAQAREPAPPPVITPRLPAPTGAHPVGRVILPLTDTGRPDPWVPAVKARKLMVSVWFPAQSPGTHRSPYMSAEESRLLLEDEGLRGPAPDVLSRTVTGSFTDARPAGRAGSLPLVILSPGFHRPRSALTSLAEELASRGYVAVAIDHTYENVATTFPGGRVATCVACAGLRSLPFWRKLSDGRAADVSFVLDQLPTAWDGGGLIDLDKIAMVGHSVGGAGAVTTLVRDPRLKAGVNLDGTVHSKVPEKGLDRPFLFLGKAATYTPGTGPESRNWEATMKRLTGWKKWLVLQGAVHHSFSDLSLLAEQVGVDLKAQVKGARSVEITRAYVVAFLDRHLLGQPETLLDGPSSRFPEVTGS